MKLPILLLSILLSLPIAASDNKEATECAVLKNKNVIEKFEINLEEKDEILVDIPDMVGTFARIDIKPKENQLDLAFWKYGIKPDQIVSSYSNSIHDLESNKALHHDPINNLWIACIKGGIPAE